MAKQFLEVFPTLKLKNETAAFLEQVTVERITATKRKFFLLFLNKSDHLISKYLIY